MEARRCRHPHRSRAAADVSRRVPQGPRRADVARVLDGEAVCERDGGEGRRRLRANPRRLRVREGLPGRKILPRREADDHRRRHERNPAPGHRAAALVSMTLAERVLAGDPRAMARAISLIEDEDPASGDLVRAIFSQTGRAYLIGVTGPPGAGKSTLVDRLVTTIRTQNTQSTRSQSFSASSAPASSKLGDVETSEGGRSAPAKPKLAGQKASEGWFPTVGVIAVDPTSPFTGGAVLGDRLRMQSHAADEGVFIRSMATRGHLGGLARATGDAALVLDAAGKDLVIIETVGFGQDEVDIIRTADASIVTLVPGAGDDVQALKAGIMEIADIFVVNKADRDGADRLVASVEALLSLHTYEPGDWRPPIIKTVATTGAGVTDLDLAIRNFRTHAAGRQADRRKTRSAYRLRELVSQRFMSHLERDVLAAGEFDAIVERIAARDLDPYTA